MSKYYGQVEGAAQTVASRRGFREIKVSAQSWDGSVIVRLRDKSEREFELDKEDIPIVTIEIEEETSRPYGTPVFTGTIAELKELFDEYDRRQDDCR